MESKTVSGQSRIPRAPKRALQDISQSKMNVEKVDEKKRMGEPLKPPSAKRSATDNNAVSKVEPKTNADSWEEISEKNGMDIDSLLNVRMTGKGKWDHKGRCEQMMPYIKQLRACIKYLRVRIDEEDTFRQNLLNTHDKELEQREKELCALREMAESVEKEQSEMKEKLKLKDAECNSYAGQKEMLTNTVKEQKLEIDGLKKDLTHEQKVVSEKATELEKMQETYFKSQEYAQNLQDFVKKLQDDTKGINDTVSKLQDEKAKIADELGIVKGSCSLLESQLESAKENGLQLEKQCCDLKTNVENLTKEKFEAECEWKGKLEDSQKNLENSNKEFESKVKVLKQEASEMAREYEDSLAKKEKEMTEMSSKLESQLESAKENGLQLEKQCRDLKTNVENLTKEKFEAECEWKGKLEDSQKNLENSNKEFESKVKVLKQEASEMAKEYEDSLAKKEKEMTEMSSEFHKAKDTLESSLAETSETLKGSEERLKASEDRIKEVVESHDELSNNFENCQKVLKEKSANLEAVSVELQSVKGELDRYQKITGKSSEEMEKLIMQSKDLKTQNSSQSELLEAMKQQYELVRQKLQLAEEQCQIFNSQICEKSQMLADHQMQLQQANQQIQEGELARRKLHNTILELKGNIRVFCRSRPPFKDEHEEESMPTISCTQLGENKGKEIQLHMSNKKDRDNVHYNFNFDRVFDKGTQQEQVFGEISQLVQSALDGYKVCIFAYGQTGSGKTHTMIGNSADPGMIPRSLHQIFYTAENMKEHGWTYNISVTMMEIYNEEYRDLLGNKLPAGKQHSVKHDQQGRTTVTYMNDVKVNSSDKVTSLLEKAMSCRSVGATQSNEHSSRSHFVFTLKIDGTNKQLGQHSHGVLNLVDLAGSERLSKSGATGDRLKETQNINKSLSALGDVISSINNGDSHIPYRNSKLTWLLQPCLGGQSKVLMFVNISPSAISSQETLCSLRFASKVNACEIGTAKRFTT